MFLFSTVNYVSWKTRFHYENETRLLIKSSRAHDIVHWYFLFSVYELYSSSSSFYRKYYRSWRLLEQTLFTWDFLLVWNYTSSFQNLQKFYHSARSWNASCILLIIRSVFPSAEKKGSSHLRPSAIWNGESTKEARENWRVRGTHTRKRFVLFLTVDRKISSSARTSRRSEFFRVRSKQKKKKKKLDVAWSLAIVTLFDYPARSNYIVLESGLIASIQMFVDRFENMILNLEIRHVWTVRQ